MPAVRLNGIGCQVSLPGNDAKKNVKSNSVFNRRSRDLRLILKNYFPQSLDDEQRSLPLARKIAFINYKGGVGKTSLFVNIGASLTKLGQRVLICDFDTQSNASIWLMKRNRS